MEYIFHEKQEGYLCAQHCLNSLLQGPYFNAVDLGTLATQLDEEEELRMAEAGLDSEDYRRFREQPSGNMDDSGYFSVQVISRALKVWGLELIPYNSTEPIAELAKKDPTQMQAYICNYKGHWFTIRKIGNQWFNLNSLLSGPELLSNTYVSIFFATLLQDGYSIFVIIGDLPECRADEIILRNPVVPKSVPMASSSSSTISKPESIHNGFDSPGYRLGSSPDDEEVAQIRQAVEGIESVKVPARPSNIPARPSNIPGERIIPIDIEDDEGEEDEDLKRALALSLQEADAEDVRLHLGATSDGRLRDQIDEDEDDDLQKALQLSLECVTAPPTPDPEDVRWRRLRYMGLQPTSTDTPPKLNT